YRDRPAAPRDLARDREPGESAADDAKIDVEIMAQRRPLRHRDHGCGVPARAVSGLIAWRHQPLMPRRHASRKRPVLDMPPEPESRSRVADAPPDAIAPRQI